MKSFGRVMRMAADSFIAIYQLRPFTVSLMVFVTIVSACYSYASVYLSKVLLDSIVDMKQSAILWSLSLLTGFQLLKLILEAISSMQTVKLSIAFSGKSDEALIEHNAKLELLAKESPSFQGDFSYLKFADNKIYENYLKVLQLMAQLIVFASILQFLTGTYYVFSLLAVAVGILKGVVDLVTVKKRVSLNTEIESSLIRPMYYYNLLTGVDSQKELTLYGATSYFKQKWIAERDRIDAKKIALDKMDKRNFLYKELLTIVGSVFVIMLLVILIANQQLSVGHYIAVTMAVAMIVNVISVIIQDYSGLFENLKYVDKANDMRTSIANKSVSKPSGATVPFRLDQKITVSNLYFKYPNSQTATLKNITMTIHKGETIALLGENGSGKTTLVKLLLGLYKVEDHRAITFDEMPINQFDDHSLHASTSAVFQDFIKYQTNIRENVAIGDLASVQDDAKLEGLLRKVNFDKALPQGLETPLGFIDLASINLSGGQWQKLALSRVFMKEKPELVIFDEPTSALDPLAELKVIHEVLDYCRDTTTIVISHRVGIGRKADKICVMQQGEIVEFGTHEELLQRKQAYYEMWNTQKEWYEEERTPLALTS
ncbi:ABC transporter ATP-binding protein [Paenibacillus aurantiacus]|uniref:ABC transporter ATP-binding protein n=1 Tax=Paenibacillus aurantiacus TaxID=1936118 RepID=A0ABV5KGR1_9BACL